MRSVVLRLPDRPALSEHSNKAFPLCLVSVAGNQRRRQKRKRTSTRWPHLISLGSSWFSPLVGELWLRDSLNDQGQATFRTNNGSDQSSTNGQIVSRVKDCITQIER